MQVATRPHSATASGMGFDGSVEGIQANENGHSTDSASRIKGKEMEDALD
jgi:hypothetical protein